MTLKKKRRLYILLTALLGLGTATALVLTAFQDNLVFFYSPSDLKEHPTGGRSFRLGGLVETGRHDTLALIGRKIDPKVVVGRGQGG